MFACKACVGADPTQDTVKLDAAAIAARQEQQLEEQRKAVEMVEEQAREAEMRLAEERLEAERKRADEEERTRRELEERARREEEEAAAQLRAQEQAAAVEEAARIGEQERAVREAAEVRARKATIERFLKEHGFKGGVSAGKRSLMSTTYPLHAAAKQGDARIIELLLKEGADPTQKNSSGKTAAQIAEKINKNNSHASAIRVLTASRAVSGGRVGGC